MNPLHRWRRVALLAADATLVSLALALGYLFRFNLHVPQDRNRQLALALLVVVPVRLVLFWAFQLYRGLLRYAGAHEAMAIVMATAAGTAVFGLLNVAVIPLLPEAFGLPAQEGRLLRVPLVVVLNEAIITVLLVGGWRFARRIALTGFLKRRAPDGATRRVVIVGAGDAGADVAKQMIQARGDHEPVAFVDDSPHKRGLTIHRKPVAGSLADLPRVVADYQADEVLVALAGLGPAQLRAIVESCEHSRVALRILPHVSDVLAGRVSINQVRPVEIEDLLGREAVRLTLPADRNYVAGRTVMVTGAGGSIGGELCRQLLGLGAAKLVLVGHGENSIYEISQELIARRGATEIVPVIADIREWPKTEATFAIHKPQVVFHAAAHKHVPLMEAHPDEAVKNNVTGTLNVAKAALAHGAERFILISSDKAVRPTNVMGATKRIAEKMVFALAAAHPGGTLFVAVRFGNVLGSRGSVVPLFKRQIAAGGPITLTHPDITRYFMTIPEAVSLVIQAGGRDERGRLYLLDMGQPVRIADLARNLIRLSGFDPDRDIEVRFTGLRPGEKLKEELLTDGEDVVPTDMDKIFATEPECADPAWLWNAVTELQTLAGELEPEAIKAKVKELVPDYGPEIPA